MYAFIYLQKLYIFTKYYYNMVFIHNQFSSLKCYDIFVYIKMDIRYQIILKIQLFFHSKISYICLVTYVVY